MTRNIRFALAFAFALVIPNLVQAQVKPPCDERKNVLETLEKKYEEVPTSFGVTMQGGLVEVITSEDGSTWSILVSTPGGMTCLVAAGEGWRDRPRKTTGPDA